MELSIQTTKHSELVDVTSKILEKIPEGLSGLCVIYIPHTTSAITINEGADPSVKHDVLEQLSQLIPWNQSFFQHREGNSAAHIKSILVGNSVTVIVQNGELQLGTWERIFFCEFDGPRRRTVWLQFMDGI
jgi:secondary thiamine-phosphate synthase enzyme